MSRTILRAKHLTKTFYSPNRHLVLDRISLEVDRGETIAITGPSGAGKSTLLYILSTLDRPDSGHLEISTKDALKHSPRTIRNRHIGFIFQNFKLLEGHTAIENVSMPAWIGRKKIGRADAEALLGAVNLNRHADRLVKTFSGGEKQRVAIARALCNDPALILADEPTGNLDEVHSTRIHDLLLDAAKKLDKGLIVATHDLSLSQRCDRIYILQNARLERVKCTLR